MVSSSTETSPPADISSVLLQPKAAYHLSRNQLARYFLDNLMIPKTREDLSTPSFDVINIECSFPERSLYRICPETSIKVLSRRFKLVFMLDMSASMHTVDNAKVIMGMLP